MGRTIVLWIHRHSEADYWRAFCEAFANGDFVGKTATFAYPALKTVPHRSKNVEGLTTSGAIHCWEVREPAD
ncbi:MAG: hypothetical protein KatS3mg110_4620 [Pirellulaceae bacterium]|nr:MAG: hypothetical protein KatS3mg110_4620 [Pirellulaceae bacterium]